MAFQMKRIHPILVGILVLCMAAVLPDLSIAQNPATTNQMPDPLGRLKGALSNAGATALTSAQESALTALIDSFRTANGPTTSATRLAYDNYILAGNADQAIALIPILQAEQSAQAQAKAQAEINFSVNVVAILTAGQLASLQQSLGADELVRLIQSLAGGPGPGGGPPGPPMN